MNVEYFFYTLNKSERARFIRFVSDLLKTGDYSSVTMTPIKLWLHIHRYKMSVRLSNLLHANIKRLPAYAEIMNEERFFLLRGAGVKMWEEFKNLRDTLMEERAAEYPQEDEDSQSIRKDNLG